MELFGAIFGVIFIIVYFIFCALFVIGYAVFWILIVGALFLFGTFQGWCILALIILVRLFYCK